MGAGAAPPGHRAAGAAWNTSLEGLRGIFAMAIVVAHAGWVLQGSWLAMDAFFVLSGFLITRLLLREVQRTGQIDVLRFYARRARRLLPAALVVLLAVCGYVALSTAAADLPERRGDLLASLLYYANWHFIATDQDYFATADGASPLRHFWSLAVEEQFYLVWPLALAALWRATGGRIVLVAGALAVATTGALALLPLVADPANPSRAHYGTDARAHQLLVGALLAALLLRRSGPHPAGPAVSVVAFAAFCWATAFVGEGSPIYFAGGSIVVSLTVAALFWGLERGRDGRLARGLTWLPLVYLGRIAYGLYLWHWPVLVWATDQRVLSGDARRVLVVALSVALAAASYELVERRVLAGRPVRLVGPTRRLALTTAVLVGVTALAALGATRLDAEEQALQQAVADRSDRACSPGPSRTTVGRSSWCVQAAAPTADAPVIATAGDSTSRALHPGMREQAVRSGFGYVQAGQGGCSITGLRAVLPTPDAAAIARQRTCEEDVLPLLRSVRRHADPDLWVVSDSILLRRLAFPQGPLSPTDPAFGPALRPALRRSIDVMTRGGAQVAVLLITPRAQPVSCVSEDAEAEECRDPSHRRDASGVQAVNAELRRLDDPARGVHVVSLTDVLCPGSDPVCRPLVEGRVLRYDGAHFTRSFSRRVVPVLLRRIREAQGRTGVDGALARTTRG